MHPTDAAPAAPGAMPLPAWSADMFAKLDDLPTAPVLSPVLARGAITLVTGARGVGKSWLALAMAHAAAGGGEVLGWSATAAHRVVHLDLCGGQGVLRERLAAIAGKRPSPRLVLVPGDAMAGGLPDLAAEAGLTALDLCAADADLVVLDGLSALITPGRGVGARWAALAQWLRALRRRGLAVLLVDAAEPRAIAALADTVLRLERPLDWTEEEGVRFALRVRASRGLPAKSSRRFEARLELRRSRAVWTRIDDTDHRAILAWRMHEGGFSSRDIAKALEVSPVQGWRLVQRGEAIDPAIRDSAEIREIAKEEHRADAAACREAEKKARQQERMKAAWAQVLGRPARRHDPHPPPSPAGGGRDAAQHLRDPLPPCGRGEGEGGSAAAVKKEKGQRQTANSPEAVKHPPPSAAPPLTRAQLQWRMSMKELLRGRPP